LERTAHRGRTKREMRQMKRCLAEGAASYPPAPTAPHPLMVPPPRKRKSRFWQVLALMVLGVCIPLDLYAVNLFFIGCPVHRVLDAFILRYLLNVSLAPCVHAERSLGTSERARRGAVTFRIGADGAPLSFV
jgi:hypothetical protein